MTFFRNQHHETPCQRNHHHEPNMKRLHEAKLSQHSHIPLLCVGIVIWIGIDPGCLAQKLYYLGSECLCKHIREMIFRVDVVDLQNSVLHIFTNEVMSNVHMLCSSVVSGIVGQSNRSLIIFLNLCASHLFVTHVLKHRTRPKNFLNGKADCHIFSFR